MTPESVIEIPTLPIKKKKILNPNGKPNLSGYISPPTDNLKVKRYAKIYNVHKYWSRKPWYPISECIKKYSNKQDLVVDMFMGSGVVGLEASILGRDFVGFDLNPMSIFIASNTFSCNFDAGEFKKDLDILKTRIEGIASEYYSVKDKCANCKNNLMIKHCNIGPKHKGKETVALYCYSCSSSRTQSIRPLKKKELNDCHSTRSPKISIPDARFPEKFYKDRFSYKGVSKVSDMYTSRNYYFLGLLLREIHQLNSKYRDLLLTAFSNTVLHASKLKSENVRPLNVNNYWLPDDYFEENPWFRYLERIDLIISSKEILSQRIKGKPLGKYKLNNISCFKTKLDSTSVDYILTDPPYGDAIQYSELSFMWNSWMGFNFDNEKEVVINPVQGKKIGDYLGLLEKSVVEASRILKKDKFYTLCFHNKEFSIWKGVLDIFKNNNFVLENIDIVNTKGNPYNSNWAQFSPKSDLYLTFRKNHYIAKYHSEHRINDFIRELFTNITTNDPASLYDFIAVNLINDLYFNDYQMNVNGLDLKTIFKIYKEVKNGD